MTSDEMTMGGVTFSALSSRSRAILSLTLCLTGIKKGA